MISDATLEGELKWYAFPVSRGVRQGGVISPILFVLYIDDLLYELQQSGVGHVLTCKLLDNADILRCSRDFCKQANGILFRFGFCDPVVQTRLLLSYCMSLYGCALWSLNCSEIHLDVCFNKCLRLSGHYPLLAIQVLFIVSAGCVSV